MEDQDITSVGNEELLEASNEQSETQPEQAAPQQGEPEVPEKWRGKSMQDVIRSQEEAEKKMHEVLSERAQLKRQAEESAQRLYELQAALYQQSQNRTAHETPDPFANIEEEVAADPVAAIKKIASAVKELPKRTTEEALKTARVQQGREYYERAKKENPDFAERESEMGELARRYQHLIRPDMLESKEAIEVLDLMSRGQRVDKYISAAVDKVRKERDTIKQEKRQAFSESSNSQADNQDDGISLDDFTRVSDADQEKELARLARSLGRSKKF